MRILVTNDDGIYAPGLWLLADALQPLGEVVVVAPDREQSGVASSISLHSPIHVTRLPGDVPSYAVQGTPADAVIIALGHILYKKKVDLIISGINAGSNVGTDVLYSGTVGAALQGHFRGIPSLAISVTSVREPKFEVAASVARILAAMMHKQRIFKQVLLNVNVPSLARDDIEGVEITRLAKRRLTFRVKTSSDSRTEHLRIVREPRSPKRIIEEGTDVWAIRNKRVSLCPIWYDLTEVTAAPHLKRARTELGNALGLVRGKRPPRPEKPKSEAPAEEAPSTNGTGPAKRPRRAPAKKNPVVDAAGPKAISTRP